MGQAISKFGITGTSFVNPPIGASLDEEMYIRFQPSFERLQNIHDNLEKLISTPVPHKEPMFALLPRLSDPFTSRYSSLSLFLATPNVSPDRGVTTHNPRQTSNPTPAVSNIGSIPSSPIPFVDGGKFLAQVVFVSSNTWGNPQLKLCLYLVYLLLVSDRPLL